MNTNSNKTYYKFGILSSGFGNGRLLLWSSKIQMIFLRNKKEMLRLRIYFNLTLTFPAWMVNPFLKTLLRCRIARYVLILSSNCACQLMSVFTVRANMTFSTLYIRHLLHVSDVSDFTTYTEKHTQMEASS
jgi:hypothetical protein